LEGRNTDGFSKIYLLILLLSNGMDPIDIYESVESFIPAYILTAQIEKDRAGEKMKNNFKGRTISDIQNSREL
jgi:hypothetical protein